MAAPAQHSAEPERLCRIGDASRLTDIKPFVLRFWETEFPMLQPVKTPKGHRLYRRQDIEIILAIKRLLYDRGFTIPGARRHLAEQSASLPASLTASLSASASPLSAPVGADPSVRPAFPAPDPVREEPSAAAAVSAQSVASVASTPRPQPVVFSSAPPSESPAESALRNNLPPSRHSALLSSDQAEMLRNVREELRAILTRLGTR